MALQSHSHAELFYTWLSSRVSPTQLSRLEQAFVGIDKYCLRRKILGKPLFDTTDLPTVLAVQDTIKNDHIFGALFYKQRKLMALGIKYYGEYVKGLSAQQEKSEAMVPEKHPFTMNSTSKDEGENADAELQNQQGFILWLKRRNNEETVISDYVSLLKLCDEKAMATHIKNESLFSIASTDEYQDFCDSLYATPWFAPFNSQHRHRLGTVLKYYASFLSENDGDDDSVAVQAPRANSFASISAPVQVTEIDGFLEDTLFLPLRNELKCQGICTIEALKSVKLWAFMNEHNLYTIATRQMVSEKVQVLLNPIDHLDDGQLYVLHCDENIYKGETPSKAFISFCDDIKIRCPLRFRSLIGKMLPRSDFIAIYREDGPGEFLKLENPTAYVSAVLTSENVMLATTWVCRMCEEPAHIIYMDVPSGLATQHSPNISASTATEIPPVNVSPIISQQKKPLSKDDVQMIRQLEHIVQKADLEGITYADLRDELNISMLATKKYVALCEPVIEIKNKLIHKDSFIDWDDGAEKLSSIVNKLMKKNSGYLSAAQLYAYSRTDLNMFLNDNDMNDERAVFDIAQHLFEKENYGGVHYYFAGKMHISLSDNAIDSNFDIFNTFAEEQGGVFSLTDLSEHLKRIGIKTGNLYGQLRIYDEPHFLYYDEGKLISAKSMKINDAWKQTTKQALGRLFSDVGDHIILRDIQPFWFEQLPNLPGGHKWTPLLLQSVLKYYSDDLGARTIIALQAQNMDTLHTMLVQNDSPIQNFGDVVIAYIFDTNVEQRSFDAEDLRELLVEANILHANELIGNMPKALGNDERFAWDAQGQRVTVRM